MSLTLFALFVTPMYLKMVLDPVNMHKHLLVASKDVGLQFIYGLICVTLAFVMFAFGSFEFKFEWAYLFNWLALLIAVKGILLFIPPVARRLLSYVKESQLPIQGFLGLVFALALIYIDAKVL